jgi:hypothetical protein
MLVIDDQISEKRWTCGSFPRRFECEDLAARARIAALEEKTNQHFHVITMLQNKVTQLSTDFGRLVGEISAVEFASAGIETLLEEIYALKTQITQELNLV